ncbi:hypothetical protein AS593_19965 [Caulobacter vibrioides]|nr:hypothetical protein AS593_19965 [Caulobacter vibrioides]
MNKPVKSVQQGAHVDPGLSGADLDAWAARNHEALEAIVAEADAQLKRGERSVLDIDRLIAEETSRFLQSSPKA